MTTTENAPALRVLPPVEMRWMSAAELAREIRPALKAAFPGVKFSVRSREFSMGSAVDVHWIDGPRERAVSRILAAFDGRRFNSSDDSTSYVAVTLPSGEAVRAGSFVHGSRTTSDAVKLRAAERFRLAVGHDIATVAGPAWVQNWTHRIACMYDATCETFVHAPSPISPAEDETQATDRDIIAAIGGDELFPALKRLGIDSITFRSEASQVEANVERVAISRGGGYVVETWRATPDASGFRGYRVVGSVDHGAGEAREVTREDLPLEDAGMSARRRAEYAAARACRAYIEARQQENRLARAFCDVIEEWLLPGELDDVRAQNREYRKNGQPTCATHDYCDANQAMADAFDAVLGRPMDLVGPDTSKDSPDTLLINAAWKIASDAEFRGEGVPS